MFTLRMYQRACCLYYYYYYITTSHFPFAEWNAIGLECRHRTYIWFLSPVTKVKCSAWVDEK